MFMRLSHSYRNWTMKALLLSTALGAALAYGGYKCYKHVSHLKMLKSLSFENDFKTTDASKWMAEPITPKDELLSSNDVRSKMEILCMDLQAHLCRYMEIIDGKGHFTTDRWMRNDGNGGGISCVLQGGRVFEKAGINISVITSTLSENAIQQMKERSKDLESGRNYSFRVVGISSVNHPLNPHAPTMHFNFRYFEVTDVETGRVIWWFGGGSDLTPYFLYEEDAKNFHRLLKDACDAHSPSYYPDFKKWCDEYFFIKHRNEERGVGGIFFDDLDSSSSEDIFEFVRDCAAAIAPSYLPIIVKRMCTSYCPRDKEWQLIRRGRYVEFNLIYDRGTKFGLFTPEARIESIFVSMPPYAKWVYCHQPCEDKRHQELMDVLTKPREWA